MVLDVDLIGGDRWGAGGATKREILQILDLQRLAAHLCKVHHEYDTNNPI